MADKFGRLITHTNTNGGLVGDESFKDSILDLINYLVFLYCSVNPEVEEKNHAETNASTETSSRTKSGSQSGDAAPFDREMVQNV